MPVRVTVMVNATTKAWSRNTPSFEELSLKLVDNCSLVLPWWFLILYDKLWSQKPCLNSRHKQLNISRIRSTKRVPEAGDECGNTMTFYRLSLHWHLVQVTPRTICAKLEQYATETVPECWGTAWNFESISCITPSHRRWNTPGIRKWNTQPSLTTS